MIIKITTGNENVLIRLEIKKNITKVRIRKKKVLQISPDQQAR